MFERKHKNTLYVDHNGKLMMEAWNTPVNAIKCDVPHTALLKKEFQHRPMFIFRAIPNDKEA